MLAVPATGLKGVTNRQREGQREAETEGEKETHEERNGLGRRGRPEERGLE